MDSVIVTSQLFIIPASIFFAALGVANTEQLKTGVSFLGVVTSIIWFAAVTQKFDDTNSINCLVLAVFFFAVWGACLYAHGSLWIRKLKKANPLEICKKAIVDLDSLVSDKNPDTTNNGIRSVKKNLGFVIPILKECGFDRKTTDETPE